MVTVSLDGRDFKSMEIYIVTVALERKILSQSDEKLLSNDADFSF